LALVKTSQNYPSLPCQTTIDLRQTPYSTASVLAMVKTSPDHPSLIHNHRNGKIVTESNSNRTAAAQVKWQVSTKQSTDARTKSRGKTMIRTMRSMATTIMTTMRLMTRMMRNRRTPSTLCLNLYPSYIHLDSSCVREDTLADTIGSDGCVNVQQ
jgi:hypothetical protein